MGSPWFSYDVYDTIKDYYLTFSVEGTTQDDNHRGPFTNHRDYEWKFTGSVDKWAYTGYPSNISPLSLYSM
ncbi:hypothetical protein RirG_019050 [Rhizophagus irregularis DAOM 197198w]|uniref:Uncharacterized protein n=1 Tax=Rhizophagus irregularis (strain DAOM 197198w) TaxID=1432141 RepID=A0A015LE34_RHIIW|nr:hypothetical protein RirG_019050 [Rhizophagus irregularis DAOM 197198w]